MSSGRRLSLTIRGREVDVAYVEPAGEPYQVSWWIVSTGSMQMTGDDLRTIGFACLGDLVERRRIWLGLLAERRERMGATGLTEAVG